MWQRWWSNECLWTVSFTSGTLARYSSWKPFTWKRPWRRFNVAPANFHRFHRFGISTPRFWPLSRVTWLPWKPGIDVVCVTLTRRARHIRFHPLLPPFESLLFFLFFFFPELVSLTSDTRRDEWMRGYFFFPPLLCLSSRKAFIINQWKKRNFEITSFFNYPSNVFVLLVWFQNRFYLILPSRKIKMIVIRFEKFNEKYV